MENFKIKEVIQNIYRINYSQTNLQDGEELIIENGVSDFVTLFKYFNGQKGIVVNPAGYEKGLCYKSSGEVFNNPSWYPEIVKFNLNILGLKRNSIYKLTIIARDTGSNKLVTTDRSLNIHNEHNESIMNKNLTGKHLDEEYHSIFRATGNETTLFFSIGKIAIKDIILDEVSLLDETVLEENKETISETDFHEGKIVLAAYGIYNSSISEHISSFRYQPMTRISGKGLNLYLDTETEEFVLERDNLEDTLQEPFTLAKYIVEINTNKIKNPYYFTSVITTDISSDYSANTLKEGYMKFSFIDHEGKKVHYKQLEGSLYILVKKFI